MVLGLRTLSLVALLTAIASPAVAADTWSTPHPGVRHLLRTTSAPWRISAVEIDLCASGVSLRATASGERKRTVSSFAKLVGAEAAVNGDFFSFSTYGTSGLSVGKGGKWADTGDSSSSGFFAFGLDRLDLSKPSALVSSPPAWMREVVSGRQHIVNAGVVFPADTTTFCSTRHPRTAAGFSKDRRKLILAVVDGRTQISVGMRCTELGKLMAGLGAWDALNLDGGGSSAMFIAAKGVVNDPSDGVERVVANHLSVQADGSGEPGSCDRSWEAAAVDGDAYGASPTTDVDGDGRPDVCARAAAGVRCALSTGTSFSAPLSGPALSDASGWADASNYSTLRFGDVDGDGRADVCARSNSNVSCWLSDGAGFPTKITGPPLADSVGWAAPEYYGTLRMADFDGDGRHDLCVRSASDFRCYPSTGSGFGAAVSLSALADASGWNAPQHYGTIRMGDIDGDGKADLCARAAAGMRCWKSTGTGWDAAISGPDWSNAKGWAELLYWSTIRLVDVDGDGRADLCARSSAGVSCHLSDGAGFGPAVDGPAWSDASGWARYKNAFTLRFADIDGDGDQDVCARANAGIRCAPWTGIGFGAAIAGPELSDAKGWSAHRFYSSIRLADVDGDGRADVCARSAAGVQCWLSDGAGFPSAIDGPDWSDASGWSKPQYYETLRLAGGDGVGAAGADGGVAGTGGAGGAGWSDGGIEGGSGALGGTTRIESDEGGGCGCRAAPRGSAPWGWLAFGVVAAAAARRARRRMRRGAANKSASFWMCAGAMAFGGVACGGDDSSPGSPGTGAATGSGGGGTTGGSGGIGAAGGGAGVGASAGTGVAGSGGIGAAGSGASGGSGGVDLGCSGDPKLPFNKEQDISAGKVTGLSALDIADVNGDGRLDVGVFEGGKHGNGGVHFAWFEAPVGAGSWTKHDLPKPSPFKPFIGAAKFGDINKDGKPDVVVSMDEHSGAPPSAYLYWLQNPGASGTWAIHKIASNLAVEHINDLELADMDGDGKLDVVVRSLSPNQLIFYFQDSADVWQQRVIDTKPYGATGEGFAIGDIDRKGALDVSICGHWLAAPTDPRTGSYAAHDIDKAYKTINANVKEAIGDINGDGRNDVILSPAEGYRNGKNHVLAWYEAPADPTAAWKQHVLATNFNGGHTVRLADMDGDGDLDAISGVAWNMWGQTANVTVYRGCAGALGNAEVVVTGKGLYTGVVGDIGNDGDMDIVGQNTYSASSHPYLYESTASGK